MDHAILCAFKDELGERKWDDEKGTYTRMLHPEEKRLIADMDRVLSRCRETMEKVIDTYLEHLDDTAKKPLTYNTPEEEARLETVMETKEEYKAVRTLYSDAMIDLDGDLATGATPSASKQRQVEDTKKGYEEMSERLCEDALKYEQVYREELAQRVSSHFMAEQHLLRGVSTAMKDFMPYTRGLTLNWEEMRATRRANLAAAKRGDYAEDDGLSAAMESSLPRAGSFTDTARNRDGMRADKASSSGNPFGDVASNLSQSASNAATSIATASKNTSKNIAGFVANYAPKPSAKTTAKVAASGLDNVKL